jgi:hypothetical protein
MRLGALCVLACLSTQAHAGYCPSFTLSSADNTQGCATEAATGQNPSVAEWNALFEALSGEASSWPVEAPALGTIGQGCQRPQAPRQVPAVVPCEMFKGIAMQESLWQQFCVPDRPTDQVGKPSQTIIAPDCGYGVVQVTSGMRVGETPSYQPARVASEPFYNLAVGANILMQKWRVTACVGDNQPRTLEHWYSAVWAYNGLSYKNNPMNPVYSSARGVWNPRRGGTAPYQEKVYGWLEHPPTPAHWTALALAYPKATQVGGGGAPLKLDEPSCAAPLDCSQARPTHESQCGEKPAPDGGTQAPPADAGFTPDAATPSPVEEAPAERLVGEGAPRWESSLYSGCQASPGRGGFWPGLLLVSFFHFFRSRKGPKL